MLPYLKLGSCAITYSISETQHIRFFPPTVLFSKHAVLPCCTGDIQIGMVNKKGKLEVEVIRARGLIQKPGSKSLPGQSL